MSAFYTSLARYYDALYGFKDYGAEVAALHTLLSEHGVADGSRLLDAACGTGNHLVHLREPYAADGFDVSPEMVALAGEKVPGSTVWVADLRTFTVEKPYDAVVSLFSSVGHLGSSGELEESIRAMARGVRPGGYVLVEPWFPPDELRPGLYQQTVDRDDLKITRQTKSTIDDSGDDVVLRLHMAWMIWDADAPEPHVVMESHRMLCVPYDALTAMFERAALEVHRIENGLGSGRVLFVGRKR